MYLYIDVKKVTTKYDNYHHVFYPSIVHGDKPQYLVVPILAYQHVAKKIVVYAYMYRDLRKGTTIN